MKAAWRILAVWMMGGSALAQPVPPPPDGFAGAQYIDGNGCVFGRQRTGWVQRLDGQGQAVCGFPPSLDARRRDAAADRVLPLTPGPAPDPATLLMEHLSRDLRPGEWTGDPRPAETRSEPQPSRLPDPVQTAITDAMQAAPAIREAAGLTLSPETCARLGYRPDGSGQASSSGLCAGMVSEPGLAGVTPVVQVVPATRAPQPAAAPPAAARPAVTRPAATRPAAPTPRAAAPVATVAPPAPARSTEEMIPPSARYVQVGAYSDEDNARIVLRALAARGYPTGQTRSTSDAGTLRVIMAGPFADRQALISALNDLRRNGWPGAVAR